MKLAHNPETGEYLGLVDGQWVPVKVAHNDAGDLMALGADGWEASGHVSTPNQPKAPEQALPAQEQPAEEPAETQDPSPSVPDGRRRPRIRSFRLPIPF